LQHSCPTLHVFWPHISLTGAWMRGVQGVWSQLSPCATQVPQLALQQTCPELQVFWPHIVLTG
jgi:hypothetical protein